VPAMFGLAIIVPYKMLWKAIIKLTDAVEPTSTPR
jgi:hypothetical protein